ncbi:DMT family transporter [Verrucomicrobiaceae bacterium 227]
MPIGDLCAIGSAIIWSFSVILMRVSGLTIPALPLTFFKIVVAIICFAIVLTFQGQLWVTGLTTGDYLRLSASAVLGISIADTMIASALNRLGASLQALADCAYSPSIALVGLLMFGEKLSSWELIGGSLVVSGVFVGAAMTTEVKNKRDLWIGVALAAGAHVIMAIGILMVRDIYTQQSLVWVSGFRFLIAALVMLIAVAVTTPKQISRKLFLGFQRPETWRTMIPMAILGPFIATLLWVAGFKYLPAGRAAIFNQLSTVFIIVLAYLFLNEKFTTRKAIGTALALIGSLLVATH